MSLRTRYGRPGFVVPGAQKCGTTALAVYLNRHPRLRLARTKEPDFFSRHARYALGAPHYRREFSSRRLERRPIFFEASVAYLAEPSAPARLADFDPGLRLVVMVREPAGRAHSAWNMYRTLVEVPGERRRFRDWLEDHNPDDRAVGLEMLDAGRYPPFSDAVDAELDEIAREGTSWTIPGIVSWGLYADQLERFLDHFPREQLLILEDRQLADEPAPTLDLVLAFLGLEPWDWGDSFPRVLTGAYEQPADEPTLSRLREFYAEPNRRFFELAGRTFDW